MDARPETGDDAPAARLLGTTYRGFVPLAEKLAQMDARLADACASGTPSIAAKAQQIRRKIREFEPSITLIGQVKAGKTTLVNAMTGWRDLLPADVNPWTSVVTSLHLAPGRQRATRNAAFTFFSDEEWTHLVRRGGRIGELASRAGADDELNKVRAQLEKMREKSRERLGKRFEMLLGQSHDYDNFDAALIERYVCLGDDFWEEAGGDRDKGRFADITRSADLWLQQPALPVGLCLRDTPGVNDTFMIREQITINALRGSRLCVMVLSATQALTTVDFALISLISNVKSRDVIIFVNRIDELADPAREIPEIRASIQDTLRRHNGPTDAEIIFGCGFWASHAIAGQCEALDIGSAEALLNWAEATVDETSAPASLDELVWQLSGMHALGQAIATRIEHGAGAQILNEIEIEIGNLDQSVATSRVIDAPGAGPGGGRRMDLPELTEALAVIEARVLERMSLGLRPLRQSLAERVEASRATFVARATASVVKHIENYGELEVWTYDPCGLRVLLRSNFQRHIRAVTRHGTDCLETAATELSALYARAFDLGGAPPVLTPPPLPMPDAPVVLGQTIALDLRSNWWTRFWRARRGVQAYCQDFAKLIEEETRPILETLVSDNARRFEDAVAGTLAEFVAANRRILLDIADGNAAAAQPAAAPAPRPSRPVRPLRHARTHISPAATGRPTLERLK